LNAWTDMQMPASCGRWIGVVVAGLAAASCSERSSQVGEAPWTTYQDVAPLLAQRCTPCHSGSSPGGGYSANGYLSAVSRRDDGTPRAAPGDPNALVLMAAAGALPGPHTALASPELAQLQDWVVRSRVAKDQYTVHLKGWMDPADTEQFHGLELRRNAYMTNAAADNCQHCHGDDLRGGVSHVDCNSCHSAGVFACNTCHGDSASPAPPKDLHGVRSTTALGVGAHRSHALGGRLHAAYDCGACHSTQPTPDHYAGYGHPDEPPAPVALRSAALPSDATWDRTSGTCTNAYCHQPSGPSDASPTNPIPHWTRVGAGEARCGTCHGLPPASHADNRCPACHQASYAAGQLLVSQHANGVVDLGAGPSGCSNCHGDASSPAPPKDVLGRTDESLQTVGAHRSHLEARHLLRGPIACTECHAVPASLHAPGHIDHAPPALVFPSVAGVGTLARTDGAQPSYNAGSASCGSVYCHGSGLRGEMDATPNLIRNPVWNAGVSQATCGACHGIPPQDGRPAHVGVTLTECHNCHAATVTATGAIIVTRDPVTGALSSTHIDGIVQLGGP